MNASTCSMILALGLFLAVSPVHAQQPAVSIKSPCTRSSASFCRQTFHDKFQSYAVDTFGPRALFVPLFPASYFIAFPPDRYRVRRLLWSVGFDDLSEGFASHVVSPPRSVERPG
jgi:hypothetical protein